MAGRKRSTEKSLKSRKALKKFLEWPVDQDGHKWYPIMFGSDEPPVQTCDFCGSKREFTPNYIDPITFELKRKLKYGPTGRCPGGGPGSIFKGKKKN